MQRSQKIDYLCYFHPLGESVFLLKTIVPVEFSVFFYFWIGETEFYLVSFVISQLLIVHCNFLW